MTSVAKQEVIFVTQTMPFWWLDMVQRMELTIGWPRTLGAQVGEIRDTSRSREGRDCVPLDTLE